MTLGNGSPLASHVNVTLFPIPLLVFKGFLVILGETGNTKTTNLKLVFHNVKTLNASTMTKIYFINKNMMVQVKIKEKFYSWLHG